MSAVLKSIQTLKNGYVRIMSSENTTMALIAMLYFSFIFVMIVGMAAASVSNPR